MQVVAKTVASRGRCVADAAREKARDRDRQSHSDRAILCRSDCASNLVPRVCVCGCGRVGAQPVAMGAIAAQLWRSRAWVMQYIGFTNNFALAIVQYFLPIYCLEKYGFGQVQTANIFAVYGGVAALTSFAAARLSPRFYERTILLTGEMVQTVCVAACVLLWGGCQIAGYEIPDLPIWGTFLLAAFQSMGQAWQVPGLQGCYLYLVGSAGQGMYQALFMSATSE